MNSTFRFRARFAWYLVAAVVAGVLLYLVAPILSPFLFAAILAHICLPLVDRLAKSVPRWLAASIVLVLLMLGLSLLVLIVAPMVDTQFAAFLQNVPDNLDFLGLVALWLVFGIGPLLEGFVVTPSLVGDRIGLHPVAVIFALLVFGHLFGFFGVLLALPASAGLLVGLRHLRAQYLASEIYKS